MAEDQLNIDFAVYLLQSEADDDWVEQKLAQRLADQEKLRPYLFKWEGIPGVSRQDSMIDGFRRSACCAVCLGRETLSGLIQEMQKIAIERKSKVTPGTPPYRLIPVILPGGDPDLTPKFLSDITQVDFRNTSDFEWQFHLLVSGIKGEPPGPRPRDNRVGATSTAGVIPEVDPEQYAAAYVTIFKTIKAAEREGLSKKEAEALRKEAFKRIEKKINDTYLAKKINESGQDRITVQESRTTDAT